MDSPASRKLILALDFANLSDALKMARRLAGTVGMFKVNTQLFTAAGPEAIKSLSPLGPELFLDLKFHDIPNTVAGAVTAAASLPGIRLIDVHATGGAEMMKAAVEALSKAGGGKVRPQLLGITVLTSLGQPAMRRIGLTGTPASRAVTLARLAKQSGLDGVVASPQEVRQIRRACGPKFLIVVPGIRPAPSSKGAERTGKRPGKSDDQTRIATPAEAIRAGADYLVVGRPITAAPDPFAAAQAVVEEIASAL